MRNRGAENEIDPCWGLTHLGQGSYFQLTYLKEQCDAIAENLSKLIAATQAPGRLNEFRLGKDRRAEMDQRSKERSLEYKVWEFARGSAARPLIGGFFDRIHSYQVPLRKRGAEKVVNKGWKAIDLVGSDEKGLPVILELKYDHAEEKGRSNETPLRMIVEAVAYAVAIRHMWEFTEFRKEWVAEIRPEKAPKTLASIPVFGLAPSRYWDRFEGKLQKAGVRPKGFWMSFQHLCLKLEREGFSCAANFDTNRRERRNYGAGAVQGSCSLAPGTPTSSIFPNEGLPSLKTAYRASCR